jgi:Ca2+-binding RTX toxin-like protein
LTINGPSPLTVAGRGAVGHVGTHGRLFGTVGGIVSEHAMNLTNHGKVTSAGNAVDEHNGDYTIKNSGLISSSGNLGIGLFGSGLHTIVNSGTIRGVNGSIESEDVNGVEHLTNSGHLFGDVNLLGGADVFTDFKKVNGGVNVSGIIDLGSDADIFNGGSSTVKDSSGADTYNFGAGNDVYLAAFGEADSDIVNGGNGVDTYDATLANNNDVFVNLSTGFAQISGTFDTLTSFENVIGDIGNDSFSGNNAANRLDGRDGGDFLAGGGGKDVLLGGAGADTLLGGAGRDILTGGADADSFQFLFTSESGKTAKTRDVITDFNHGEGDKIGLVVIDAIKGGGDDAFHLTGNAGQAAFTTLQASSASCRQREGAMVSGDVNGDGRADFSISVHGSHPVLGDFDL